MEMEVERLKALGQAVIDIPVLDMSVLVHGKKKQVNKVTF